MPSDSCTSSALPTPIARRTFLAGSGVSLGAMALSSLLARSLPAASELFFARSHSGVSSSAQDQAGDLALHGGRAVAPGDVRLQAGAGPPRWRADAASR